MIYALTTVILFVLQFALIRLRSVSLSPEIYFYPWLVSKGLLPYRDFFDHHGFFLYYLFAPLTVDKSLILFTIFFYVNQLINLSLILLIFRRITNKIGFIVCGVLFVLMNYFVTNNTLWFESVVATFYLLIFLLTTKKQFRYKEIIIGCLILFASFIKPNAAIILLPLVFLTYTPFLLMLPLIIGWGTVFTVYYFSHGITQLYTDLFLFNSHLPMRFFFSSIWGGDWGFIYHLIIIILFLIFISLLNKKFKANFSYILYVLSSVIFTIVLYDRIHFVPMIAYITIFAAIVIKQCDRLKSIVVIALLLFFITSFYRYIKNEYVHMYSHDKNIPLIQTSLSHSILVDLKKSKLNNKRIFILGNASYLYYFADKLPPVSMPILLYDVFHSYFPHLDSQFTNEVKNSKPEIIITFTPPISDGYSLLTALQKYINNNYQLYKKEKNYEIYIKN